MMRFNDGCARLSAQIAPLQIRKARSTSPNTQSIVGIESAPDASISQSSPETYTQTQMTPPTTPDGSRPDPVNQDGDAAPIFHNYLRAFYPFQPSDALPESTVTLPLSEGDIVLVHSIHTNGWADGTLLANGTRGWLPTNYCEPYGYGSEERMRSLLKALLHFWDLMRSGYVEGSEIFSNQEFMRGIIAGVRHLLERADCLTRESPKIQVNEALRRARKALLSDLSSLVKTAKKLQEHATLQSAPVDDINLLVDEMVLKAFKIVVRGVRFVDVLEDEASYDQSATGSLITSTSLPTVDEESHVPPTPPADVTSFGHQHTISDVSSRLSQSSSGSAVRPVSYRPAGYPARSSGSSNKRTSRNFSGLSSTSSSPSHKRSSISHRISTAGPSIATQSQQNNNLVSERLSASHDALLSSLGSFIGRLHLQSLCPSDLLLTTKQSIAAGRLLLVIIEAVCAYDADSEHLLVEHRQRMYSSINQLILAARDCVRPLGSGEEYDVMTPEESSRLGQVATDCVVAAGECVAQAKFILERVGDFELETTSSGLGIDIGAFGGSSVVDVVDEGMLSELPITTAPSSQTVPPQPTTKPPPPPPVISTPAKDDKDNKPLPLVPENDESTSISTHETSAPISSRSVKSMLPPLPKLSSPINLSREFASNESSPSSFYNTRSDSIAVLSNGTDSTYISSTRDSEVSMISTTTTSTRATTPDTTPYYSTHNSHVSDLSLNTGSTALDAENDEAEYHMLEKTFAHELLYNKEGAVTGGSLQALVEKLTTHDSTPDATFVSAFYLTFRLFVTPLALATALIDRFDYVSESPHIAGPVRLRVYNIFKGWLESHWHGLTDEPALPAIECFAGDRLNKMIPTASRRLQDLVRRAASGDGGLVPRLLSSVGRTNTSVSQYVSPDTPLPPSVITTSTMKALKNWKAGGSSPTILDFDPLELARQFTIKEMRIFCTIMPEELLASEWMKKSGSNAANVRAMSTLSTDLSNFVSDTILQHDDPKRRAATIKQWIKIAHECLKLNNYDSLMAIICSLNSSTIARLKRTWPLVSQKRQEVLKSLQEILEPHKNHSVLRQRMQNHVPPCLPFVGTYLTDLTFVDIGNPATRQLPNVGDGEDTEVINFDKHAKTAKIIGELQRFQMPYRLQTVEDIQEWIQAQIVRVRVSNDSIGLTQQYYRKSLLLEPRVTTRTSPTSSTDDFASMAATPGATRSEKFDIFGWAHSRDKSLAEKHTSETIVQRIDDI